ncbi:MAG TPA: DUF4012 domain-containing protein [Candidatus Moranbacteria bacterium]|nr:DUF4012 domain-containing protein [Candidatus Moranbacteria bacterium]
MKKIARYLAEKKAIIIGLVIFIAIFTAAFFFASGNKKIIGLKSLSLASKVSKFLPITKDEQKELEVVNKLVETLNKKDDRTWTFMIFLQNNMELRPGGGFLGQYAVVKIKNGEVISTTIEDANLLDQRITAKVAPPYPFKRMMQIKSWKFRDSNFSPDFPTNIEKAKYFYRLSGRGGDFDGFVAVNTEVFNHILALTGPITVPGYSGEYNSRDGALKLEEFVEKQYIMNPELDTQNRKMILQKMGPMIIEKLFTLGNVTKIAELVHNDLKNKNIMLNFKDPALQSQVESVFWDGKVATDWGSDYLMLVDANMGALKTDYYIKREISYDVDLTAEKPTVTLNIKYKNTAPYGDWRTSDYHTFLRVYVPKGSTFLERTMVGYPNIGEEFGKTYFGVIVHVLINGETNGMLKYELPADFNKDDYRLLVQKQSGVGDVPIKIHLKTKDGEFTQESILNHDTRFEFQKGK